MSGFKKYGLFQFNVNDVYNKCKPKVAEIECSNEGKQLSYLPLLESKIQPQIIAEFQEANTKHIESESDVTAGMLFDVRKPICFRTYTNLF